MSLFAFPSCLLLLLATCAVKCSPVDGEDSEEAVGAEPAFIDYREPPPHYRPVREHHPESGDASRSARGRPPPLFTLGGMQSDLLATSYLSVDREHSCQRMSNNAAALCGRFNYSMTRVPNLLNHQSQVEAYQQLRGYKELIKTNCAEDLLFLLCNYHLPSCQGSARPMTDATSAGEVALVTPCRGLCERVRDSCLPVLQRYGYDWPWSMQCDRLQSESIMMEPQSRRLVACIDTPPRSTPAPPQESDSQVPASPQEPTDNTAPPMEDHPTCRPRTCPSRKVKPRVIKQYKYDWVVECRYLGMIVKDRKHSLQIRVDNVIYKGPKSPRRMKVGRELIILTDQDESVCGGCPDLHALNTTYIMAGHSKGSQLVYRVREGIATETGSSLFAKMAKWTQRFYKS